MWANWLFADVSFDAHPRYWAKCPDCGEIVSMNVKDIPQFIAQHPVCPRCGERRGDGGAKMDARKEENTP